MSDNVTWDEFKQWAGEHGIDVNQCVRIQIAFTVDSVSTDQPIRMEVTEYLTDGFGRRFWQDGTVAVATRMVPLQHLPTPDLEEQR